MKSEITIVANLSEAEYPSVGGVALAASEIKLSLIGADSSLEVRQRQHPTIVKYPVVG
jgi:hypothetical protein